MGFWLTRYMHAEGDEGIFRYPFAGKFSVIRCAAFSWGCLMLCDSLAEIGQGDGGIVRHQFAVQFARYPVQVY